MDGIITLFPFGSLADSDARDVYFSWKSIFPRIPVYFHVSGSTRKKHADVDRIMRRPSPCWFLQSTGKSFQEFIRIPMSHATVRALVASNNACGSTFASRLSGYTTGNTRLRFILSCFVVPSRPIRHIIRGSISTASHPWMLPVGKERKKTGASRRYRRISRINVNVEWSEMKYIAITSARGQLCQTISLDHGDCSFITTQIIRTGTISVNIGFSFTTASDNAYLGKAQKHVHGREIQLKSIYCARYVSSIRSPLRHNRSWSIVLPRILMMMRFRFRLSFYEIVLLFPICIKLQCVANFVCIKFHHDIHAAADDYTGQSKCSGANVAVVRS